MWNASIVSSVALMLRRTSKTPNAELSRERPQREALTWRVGLSASLGLLHDLPVGVFAYHLPVPELVVITASHLYLAAIFRRSSQQPL